MQETAQAPFLSQATTGTVLALLIWKMIWKRSKLGKMRMLFCLVLSSMFLMYVLIHNVDRRCK